MSGGVFSMRSRSLEYQNPRGMLISHNGAIGPAVVRRDPNFTEMNRPESMMEDGTNFQQTQNTTLSQTEISENPVFSDNLGVSNSSVLTDDIITQVTQPDLINQTDDQIEVSNIQSMETVPTSLISLISKVPVIPVIPENAVAVVAKVVTLSNTSSNQNVGIETTDRKISTNIINAIKRKKKQIKCTDCDRSFNKKSNLKRHVAIQDGF